MIEITFDPDTQEFICLSADAQHTRQVPAKGLTKTDLLGELPLDHFSNHQYALPWTFLACRQNLLLTELTGTTL